MVEEILKRKHETVEKLKKRRSIKEAILEAKKAGKRPVIAEVKRKGLKAGEEEEVGGVCQVCEVRKGLRVNSRPYALVKFYHLFVSLIAVNFKKRFMKMNSIRYQGLCLINHSKI